MNHFFFLLYAAWQHFVLPQVRCRGHIVQALVATLPVIKYLDVIKNGFAGFFPDLESLQVAHYILDDAVLNLVCPTKRAWVTAEKCGFLGAHFNRFLMFL